MPFLKLGHSNAVQVGDKLFTLGNPLGVFQNTLSEGLLSGIRQMDGYKMFQLSAPISHGSSGGPVFDARGEVVGIVEATISEGQNLNFAIPIDYAAGMLDSKEVQPLTAFCEPEETKKPSETAAPPKEPTSAASPSVSIKQDAITYLGTKIKVWTKEDAEVELGKPSDRRDGIVNNAVVGDIYKYNSPVPNFAAIELRCPMVALCISTSSKVARLPFLSTARTTSTTWASGDILRQCASCVLKLASGHRGVSLRLRSAVFSVEQVMCTRHSTCLRGDCAILLSPFSLEDSNG